MVQRAREKAAERVLLHRNPSLANITAMDPLHADGPGSPPALIQLVGPGPHLPTVDHRPHAAVPGPTTWA